MSTAQPTAVISPGPIIGAGSRGDIGDIAIPLPEMSGTLRGYFRPMTVGVCATEIVDGYAGEIVRELATSGVILPGEKEKLKLGSEGSRSWKNWLLFAEAGLAIQTNDRIKVAGLYYRVMDRSATDAMGFTRAELTEDYQSNARI